MNQKFREENLPQWIQMLNSLFDFRIPELSQWKDKEGISKILNHIGDKQSKVLNHLFMPTGGGLDLSGAIVAQEKDCIEILTDGGAIIVKPKKLTFRSFDNSGDWSYFHLEFDVLKPTGVYAENHMGDFGEIISDFDVSTYESLTLLPNGSYGDYNIKERGFLEYDEYGDELPLPKGTRSVERYLKGSVVVFAKSSIYNLFLQDTYDGRHNTMTEAEFANYINQLRIKINGSKTY